MCSTALIVNVDFKDDVLQEAWAQLQSEITCLRAEHGLLHNTRAFPLMTDNSNRSTL